MVLMARDDHVPKLNGVVGGSIPGYEIFSLLDGKQSRWSSALCAPP